jgi:hypothetical protein
MELLIKLLLKKFSSGIIELRLKTSSNEQNIVKIKIKKRKNFLFLVMQPYNKKRFLKTSYILNYRKL